MSKKVRQVVELARRAGGSDGADARLLERFQQRFHELDAENRLELYRWLSSELEVEGAAIAAPLDAVQQASEDDREAWNSQLRNLRRAISSPRQRLFDALINTSGGMEFVLELRAEVLDAQRQGEEGLDALEEDIAHLLNRWCQHRLLFLEEIDLGSSFETIRFLKEREMVHPMVGLEEMGQRLGQDRMCFALHHVAMPEQPVVFIEVALSRGLLRSIHDVIDAGARSRQAIKAPDTAIFYSINNTQNGLAGLGLGQVLILRVTEALRSRHPSLRTFATLSPIPGFWGRYLRPILEGHDHTFRLKRADVSRGFSDKAQAVVRRRAGGPDGDSLGFAEALLAVLSRPDWLDDHTLAAALRKPMVDLAYGYIAREKDARGKPLNPVAGFHLGNGAAVARTNVNFAANRSPRGVAESCGLMVNYVYSQKAFAPLGRAVRSLLPWSRRH
ncbi:MAG: malonyl-CoA decarboxylase family protein [Holophagae bacterium]|jgi:hypothetical protein